LAERGDALVTASFEDGHFVNDAINEHVKRSFADVTNVARDYLKALDLL
jgi:hypothetical protein